MPDFPVVKTVAVPNVTPIQVKHINNLEDKVGTGTFVPDANADANVNSLDYQVRARLETTTFNIDHDSVTGHHKLGVWNIGATPVTSSAAELNKLTGTSANVNPANLNALTGGAEIGASLHSHGKYILIQDLKPSGTNGGTFTGAAWRTRTLNTIAVDETGAVVLAANQFTLPIGTYLCNALAQGNEVNYHKARLRNITDGTTTIIGTSENSIIDAGTNSLIIGKFTIAAPKLFELQHWCTVTKNTTGFGQPTSTGENEIYATVQLIKVA